MAQFFKSIKTSFTYSQLKEENNIIIEFIYAKHSKAGCQPRSNVRRSVNIFTC